MIVPKTHPDVSKDAPEDDAHAPRPLTLAENIALTLKVLGVVGLLGAALWAANLWTAANYSARAARRPSPPQLGSCSKTWGSQSISSRSFSRA
jgi:hypothetical protein